MATQLHKDLRMKVVFSSVKKVLSSFIRFYCINISRFLFCPTQEEYKLLAFARIQNPNQRLFGYVTEHPTKMVRSSHLERNMWCFLRAIEKLKKVTLVELLHQVVTIGHLE